MHVRAGLRLLLTPFSDSRDSTYYLGHHVTRAYVSGERALSLSHSQSLRTARAIFSPIFGAVRRWRSVSPAALERPRARGVRPEVLLRCCLFTPQNSSA